MNTIACFSSQGGVGNTSLVYHLACMYSDLGLSVVAADLDPQANLTSMFLGGNRLESLWSDGTCGRTVLGPILASLNGDGSIEDPHVEVVDEVGLLAGDLLLSSVEDDLSQQWRLCLEGKKGAFRVIGTFHEVLARASSTRDAQIVLIDVGPNLGAINRAALLAADHVIIPLAPDLFSLKGLQNLGPRLREWGKGWRERLAKEPDGIELPKGHMKPLGYIVMHDAVRLDCPSDQKWMTQIPPTYREAVLGEHWEHSGDLPHPTDPNCLATLKRYRSLKLLAQEARKPMFSLKPADGAIGGHAEAVQNCYLDFCSLAREIARRAGIVLP